LETQIEITTRDLLQRCRRGDRKATFEIYKLYYKAMYNSALRIVGNSLEAEEVMQDSFLACFEKMDTFSGESPFGAWLKRIVINKALDCLKKRKMQFDSIEKVEKTLVDNNIDESFESLNVKVEEIKRSISELADGYRIVLSLYLLEGYDHEEISQILKITESSSRSQLTRAKQKLIEKLNNKL